MGTCSYCKKRRDVFGISRQGGATYRRGGRSYHSSICGDCAVTCLSYAPFHAGATASSYSIFGLVRIVERIDSDEARAALTRYADGVAERKAADAERKARWEAQKAATETTDPTD